VVIVVIAVNRGNLEMKKNESRILETIISLNLPQIEFEILEEMTSNKKVDVNQMVSQIVSDNLKNKNETVKTFEENGIIYERLSIDLPQTIVNLYRYRAHSQGKDDFVTALIAFDLVNGLSAEVEGMTAENFKSMFNLNETFIEMANRECKILNTVLVSSN
jgi:hypothetical protein